MHQPDFFEEPCHLIHVVAILPDGSVDEFQTKISEYDLRLTEITAELSGSPRSAFQVWFAKGCWHQACIIPR